MGGAGGERNVGRGQEKARERGPPAPHHSQGAGRLRRVAERDQDMSVPDLKGLIETAQRLQAEVVRVREQLASKTVEGETGGGPVPCVAPGPGDGLPLTITPAGSAGN